MNELPTRQVLGLTVLITILLSLLVLDIAPETKVFSVSLLAGVLLGTGMFWRQRSDGTVPDSTADRMPSINIGHIQIRGGIGAGVIILILLAAVLVELPVLRWIALPGIFAGLAFGGLLILWRRYRGE